MLFDAELEKILLSAIIYGKELDVNPDIFYFSENRQIFNLVSSLKTQGKQIDYVNLISEMKSQGLSIQEYLVKVIAHPYIPGQEFTSLDVLNDLYLKRFYQDIGDNMIKRQGSIDELLEYSHKQLNRIEKLMVEADPPEDVTDVFDQCIENLQERIKCVKEGRSVGIPSGSNNLDQFTSGWQPGNLIYFAGRPGMGKTAMALYFTKHALENYHVDFFTMEMMPVELVNRMILTENRMHSKDFNQGLIDKKQLQDIKKSRVKFEKIKDRFHLHKGIFQLSKMRPILAKRFREGNLGLVVIDYLQLMKPTGNYKGQKVYEVGEISNELKRMAIEFQTPFIVLSQLNREVEKRKDQRPVMSDLRNTGDLEQDADLVIFIYRDGHVTKNSFDRSVELIISKNRNGSPGTVMMEHNGSMNNFRDQ